jgi:hypothetical protein
LVSVYFFFWPTVKDPNSSELSKTQARSCIAFQLGVDGDTQMKRAKKKKQILRQSLIYESFVKFGVINGLSFS